MENSASPWLPEDSEALYMMKEWGLGYFGINQKGHVAFHPRRDKEEPIDVKDVVDDVISRGVKLPVLLRFQDILRDRVLEHHSSFHRAIREHSYRGRFYGVYPIKVNQLREVVEEIMDAGEPFQIGLEAGSKGELIAVLAMNGKDRLAIVNGYKDEYTMRLSCAGWKLGKQLVVVIEKLSELELLLDTADRMGVQPIIGIRCKLQTEGAGRWRASSGHRAKFGLTTPEILAAIETLKKRGRAHCFKLVHFHIGSQVTDIKYIKNATREGVRVYAKLRKMGLGIDYLDCGGGLGVDYEGSKTTGDYSMNYAADEYARDIVYAIQEVCGQEGVPEPDIVTETGRSIVAHHSVLVADIFGSIETGSTPMTLGVSEEEEDVVGEMRDVIKSLNPKSLSESYHDGKERLEQAFNLFKLGHLSLEDKAKVEVLYWELCREIQKLLPQAEDVSDDLLYMFKSLDDQYMANFSLFLSLPDSWAVNHLFPVMPLHRLDEEPTRNASLVDITCDSDGKIDQFVTSVEGQNTLPVHQLDGEPYHIGIFLIGAYQATMGDIHNLFGRVNEVHVFEDDEEPGNYYLEEIVPGQTINDVLTSIQYSQYDLVRMVKNSVDERVKAGEIKPREGVELVNFYESVLGDYTYIDQNGSGTRAAAEALQESPPREEKPREPSPAAKPAKEADALSG